MGDTPAPAISTEAVYKTAELYRQDSRQAANHLKHSSYVDDLIDSCSSKPDALKIAKESEDILAKGGFALKCWQFSGETQPRVKEELLKLDLPEKSVESSDQGLIMLKGTDENLRVLGLGWNQKKEPLSGEKKVHQLQEAENFIVKEVQKSFESELTKTDRKGRKGGRFACLNPVQDESGLWVVGQRLKNKNSMTVDSSLQKLLPYRHVSRLFMQRAHTSGHRGRDATLARFRQLYWVIQGSKLAQSIKSKCQMCKLREAKFLEQQMGQLPEARLQPSPAFNHVMIDLFGPYSWHREWILTWIFGPADSPWYQGAVESLVKSAKRAIHFTINNQRLSVQEFMTVCSEATSLLNERPIGTLPGADSELNILTPKSLLLGRATAKNPGGWQPNGNNPGKRYHVVQIVTDEFWKKWTELYAPALVIRRKWNTANRNLRPGDVVIIADRNTLRGDYRLGIVQEVFPSQDGKVRRVNVMYKNFQIREKVQKYKGHNEAVIVSRSAQRLSLLVPVDMDQDQETKSEAKDSV
ncbi:Hypothetical predicted protein [Paramuricea clavata]|uniref:Uncharacterized protein n=1 Tax=Paramuricea clavata TaxID=317549 RepID=A0A6S7JN41_PARCT|nr:Hypothetical predicted protein [Paramuricea clavata]